ncbi:MAG: asparaginase [Vulcanimicrobiaceae bacterium]
MRGDLVESVHNVAACASDAKGTIHFQLGDIDTPIFLRSTAKPFIAAAVIEAGARDEFGLTTQEIAIMAASHSGEPFHVEAVRSILHKIGLDASALQCGAHFPYNEAAADEMRARGTPPSALYNNCSGKHAGILALCAVMGADPTSYLELNHPAQRAILAFCARMSDDDPNAWPLGIDGCGIPVYATSLRKGALAFARFASLDGVDERDARALLVVRDAMVSHPEYVAGTHTLDTDLMRAARGAIASKAGAEGVHGLAAIPQGLGFVSKVIDGSSRARGPSTLAILQRLGVLGPELGAKLDGYARPVVYNRAGRVAGEVRAR